MMKTYGMSTRDSYHGLRKCKISKDVIGFTEEVLSDCGKLTPPHEGIVYWSGSKNNEVDMIDMVIAPMFVSSPLRVSTSPLANALMIKALAKEDRIQIAQVHSHPGKWVDHSEGDDEFAPFKVNGLYSIVVPYYCQRGILPLSKCGVHIFWNEFVRIPSRSVKSIFHISEDLSAIIIDMRNENTNE